MKIEVFNTPIEFDRAIIERILDSNIKEDVAGYICTINANLLSEAYENCSYLNVLQGSFINICDGSVLAHQLGRLYKKKLESWSGPDFFLETVKKDKYKHFFLGANSQTLNSLKYFLESNSYLFHDSVFEPLPYRKADDFNYPEIAQNINNYKPDIIWLSLGAPKQEIFASKLVPYLERGIVVCVGAAFDFYGGNIKRAPKIFRETKMEWVWRIFTSPQKTINRLRRELFILPLILKNERRRLKSSENTYN